MEYASLEVRPGVYRCISAYEAVNRSADSHYRCRICNEPVDLRNGTDRTYFAHKPNSDVAKNCPLFVSNSSPYDSSPQVYYREKTGLPLYLEAIGNQFQFYLELDKADIKDVKDQGIEIQICKQFRLEPIATITSSKLSEIDLIPLNWVESKYYYLKKHSKNYRQTPGFYDDGTFFRVRSRYSRKVSFHGEVRVNVEYYFVTRKGNMPKESFLEVINEHPLITKNQNYIVCLVRFKEITDKSSNFARKCNVELVESPAEFIPIWPPMVYKDGSYTLTESATIFGKKSGSLEPGETPFVSYEVKQKSVSIALSGENSTCARINYNPSASYPQYKPPFITLKWNDQPAPEDEKIIWNKDGTLSYTSKTKCHLIMAQNKVPGAVYKNLQGSRSFPGIAVNSDVFIYHGHDQISHITFSRKQKNQKTQLNMTDDMIYRQLLKNQKNMVKIPSYVKYLGTFVSSYPKTCAYFQAAIMQGQISEDSLRTLRKLQKTGVL